MTELLRVAAGELSADELIDALNDGRRVLVDVEVAGGDHEVVLRYDGETYLCDTPTNVRHARLYPPDGVRRDRRVSAATAE